MAINVCNDALAEDIGYDCENPSIAGYENVAALIGRSSLDIGEVPNIVNSVIDSLPLQTGEKAVKIIQPKKMPFQESNSTMVEGTHYNTMDKQVQFVILTSGSATAESVRKILNGEFVLVMEAREKNDGHCFEVIGLENGAKAVADVTRVPWSDDTKSGWLVTLKESQAPTPIVHLFNTDYAGSKAIFDSLFTPAV